MAFKVVLDANVLYPFSLRDTLLRLAERELYVLCWSERILDEVSRNLVEDSRTDNATAVRLHAAMRSAFPEALVDTDAIAAIARPCDRHRRRRRGHRHVQRTPLPSHGPRAVPQAADRPGRLPLHPPRHRRTRRRRRHHRAGRRPQTTAAHPGAAPRPATARPRRHLRRRCWSCHSGRTPRSSQREDLRVPETAETSLAALLSALPRVELVYRRREVAPRHGLRETDHIEPGLLEGSERLYPPCATDPR
jgi:hypothetical protein